MNKDNLTYVIEGEGETAASLALSQAPVADATLFPSVVIQSGKTHTYKIKLTYKSDKKEDKAVFKGKINIYSESKKLSESEKDL